MQPPSAPPPGPDNYYVISPMTAPARTSEHIHSTYDHKMVAVIDIGATAVRLAIAEIDQEGTVQTLERLSQEVGLGKDTFTKGEIQKKTIENCVRVLRSYRRLLREYQVVNNDQIRVVATSAVREAENRLAFLDRIYIATGFEVEPIEEAEVSRTTYLGVHPFLHDNDRLASSNVIITEVGGGSTELLLVQNDDVAFSETVRIGSLRLLETLQAYRAPAGRERAIMENHIVRTLEHVTPHFSTHDDLEMIALGGDIRFAAMQLISTWKPGQLQLAELSITDLESFTDHILSLSDDDLVRRYGVTFRDAETLGPALLVYVQLARAFHLRHLHVTNVNLRDGLLQEMVHQGRLTETFDRQVVRSAFALAHKFEVDMAHAERVAELSKVLFRSLQESHELPPRCELLLYIAALLHEIGYFVSNRAYHKHSMYLIRNSEIFGLGRRDLFLVALTARYHRRASPKPSHEGFNQLDRDGRVTVSKLAALLRVADALDHSHSQRIQEIECTIRRDRITISVPRVNDLSLEQLSLRQKGSLFEDVFGATVELRRSSD